MDIKESDLLLLNDGMYYVIDFINKVHNTVYLRYNNYKGAPTKERMSYLENGLSAGTYKLYREVKNG